MESILSRLFSRDKIAVLLVITASILGVFEIPQQWGIPTDKILLLAIGIIALDMLVEKLAYLDRMEGNLEFIIGKLEGNATADEIFLSKHQATSFEEFLKQGNEIWLAGKSLYNLAANHGKSIEQSLKNGKKNRILIHDPDNPDLIKALAGMSYTNPDANRIHRLLSDSLDHWKSLSLKSNDGTLEIRVSNTLLPNGFTFVDPEEVNPTIYVEYFPYKVSLGKRPAIYIQKERDPLMFAFYKDQYISLWNDAKAIGD